MDVQISDGMKQAYMDYAQSVIVSKTFDDEGTPVSFSNNGTIMVNATQMAKLFGKLAKDTYVRR